MALSKPILNPVPAWDVTVGYAFTFNVVGGDQVVGSTLKIYDNESGALVYTNIVTSYDYVNIVPPNASGLSNGTYYNASLTTTNILEESSSISNTIQFYCYSTPTWEFTENSGIPRGIINSANLKAEITYSQAQGEQLNSYVVNLLDSDGRIISTSGTKYVSDPSDYIGYIFNGLSDNTQYKIIANGITVNNTQLTTGEQSFTVSYASPEGSTSFNLTNNCQEGYITILASFILIKGESYPSPATYIDNQMIDLTERNSWAKWEQGFVVSNDFTASLWFTAPNIGTDLVIMKNEFNETITLSCVQDEADEDKFYLVLSVSGGYQIYTQSVDEGYEYCAHIRCIDNLYDLVLTTL